MSERQSGWWHPGPPPHVCELPSPNDIPDRAKSHFSTWTCDECGQVFLYTGAWEEQVGPDEYQSFTHWFGPETENVPSWAIVEVQR